MALDMGNATNARNKTAIKTLAQNYEGDVKKVVNAIKGQKYTDLKNVIKTYWQGADCDNFIKQLDTKTSEIQKEVASYQTLITNALNQELANYQKFQQGNSF